MLDSLSTAATHITDHNWSFYGIIAEKRKKVNHFFHFFRIFSIFVPLIHENKAIFYDNRIDKKDRCFRSGSFYFIFFAKV
jgi:hypothetical protein